jgi:triacylglycerol lipase
MAYRQAMAASVARLARLATKAGGARPVVAAAGKAAGYALRTFGSAAGLRGIAIETAWLAGRLAFYPMGLFREHMRPEDANGRYRIDHLPPVQRGLAVTDIQAAGTPILLLHGIMDNRSAFTVFRRALRRRGFGLVHAVNYGLFTGDIRAAARELGKQVRELQERSGCERIHIVGHSLGGLIARYYVQRLGGDAAIDTLVTLGSPHGGTATAYVLPTALARQLRPGSELLGELAEPAAGCRTRFLVVWSRLDQMIVPQRNARLRHPDLDVEELELSDVGHFSLPIHPRTVHWVASSIARSDARVHPVRPATQGLSAEPPILRAERSPAS